MSTTLQPLVAGQRMSRAEFHERSLSTPDGKFELIEETVYMASPVSDRQSDKSFLANGWLFAYVLRTPGVRAGRNGTVFLDPNAEVQPDLMLMIAPEVGGQSRRVGDSIDGCPELVAEVARSSVRIDLGPKLAE